MNRLLAKHHRAERMRREFARQAQLHDLDAAERNGFSRGYDAGRHLRPEPIALPEWFFDQVLAEAARAHGEKLAEAVEKNIEQTMALVLVQELWRRVRCAPSFRSSRDEASSLIEEDRITGNLRIKVSVPGARYWNEVPRDEARLLAGDEARNRRAG